MRLLPKVIFLLLLAAIGSTQAFAQNARESLVVGPEWLAENINDPDLVILHIGTKAGYDTAHVAGARFVTLDNIGVNDRESPTGLMLQLPADAALRDSLQKLGISNNSQVVVVFGDGYLTPATRVIFTLEHVGLAKPAKLLDGGLASWTRAGRPTTAALPQITPGRITAVASRADVVSAEFVRDSVSRPGIHLVDARAAAFYSGAQQGGPTAARKRGHIPGAKSIPFNSLVNERNELLPATELARIFRDAGVDAGDTVVTYCHIGQQATLTLFAARTLGISTRLYDGSFEDWAHRGWPVVVPPDGE